MPLIEVQLINSTQADVARKCEVSEEEVFGALRRQVEARVDWESFTRLDALGLDEIALKKGHDDFVVIATSKHANSRSQS